MRHKYSTTGLVLARAPLGEASALVTLLTREVGLVRARAQSVRRGGAKLAPALATFAESELTLVRGSEGWRVSGAVLSHLHAKSMSLPARLTAARVTSLLLRLTGSETVEPNLFGIVQDLFVTLRATDAEGEMAECSAVLAILQALGLDSGEEPATRAAYIERINRGIAASGL